MERRLRACVELQATETGDLAFMYCVEARPGAGYSPMFGMSLPMEEATFFKRDVERLLDAFCSHAVGKEGGVPYGLMLTAVMSKELFGRRPPDRPPAVPRPFGTRCESG